MKTKQTKSWRDTRERLRNQAVKSISHKLLTVQRKWADWMNAKCNALPARQRQLMFLFFFLTMAVTYTLTLVSAIREQPALPARSVPKQEKRSAVPRLQSPQQDYDLTDSSLALKLKDFDHYLDSLERTYSGREKKKKFLDTHPGLLDSIKKIKELYQIK